MRACGVYLPVHVLMSATDVCLSICVSHVCNVNAKVLNELTNLWLYNA